MEIITYIDSADGFTHYIFNPLNGRPLLLWLFVLIGGGGLIILILSKFLGGRN